MDKHGAERGGFNPAGAMSSGSSNLIIAMPTHLSLSIFHQAESTTRLTNHE